MELMTLAYIKDSSETDWWKCQNAQELKDLTKTRAAYRKPLTELVNSVKTGINELKKAIVAFDQRASAKRASTSTAAGRPKKKGKVTPSSEPSLFEKGLDKGNEICAYTMEEAKQKIDMNKPALFRVAEMIKPVLEEDMGMIFSQKC